jgi:threonine dehydrogenase-like Zn-dependent dehydrogenase
MSARAGPAPARAAGDPPPSVGRTMLAAVAYPGELEFRLEELPVPSIGAHEALVRAEAVGVTRGLVALWYFTDLMTLLPGVLGHEIGGTVAAVGPGVRSVRLGDRVRVHPTLACRVCALCRAGLAALCPAQCTIGYSLNGHGAAALYDRYHNGGLAQYVRVPAANLDPIPTEVPFDVAAKVGTLAGSFRAVSMARASREPARAELSRTLVITAASGGSGAAAARCARLLGFTAVCGVATNRAGLERLTACGDLDGAIAVAELEPDWRQRALLTRTIVEAATNGRVDAVVDFMPFGRDVTVQAIRAMRPGGRAVLGGGNIAELDLSYLELMRNQYVLAGVRGTLRKDERRLIRLLGDGRLQASDLVTHSFALADVNEALAIALRRELAPVFVVVRPQDPTP